MVNKKSILTSDDRFKERIRKIAARTLKNNLKITELFSLDDGVIELYGKIFTCTDVANIVHYYGCSVFKNKDCLYLYMGKAPDPNDIKFLHTEDIRDLSVVFGSLFSTFITTFLVLIHLNVSNKGLLPVLALCSGLLGCVFLFLLCSVYSAFHKSIQQDSSGVYIFC